MACSYTGDKEYHSDGMSKRMCALRLQEGSRDLLLCGFRRLSSGMATCTLERQVARGIENMWWISELPMWTTIRGFNGSIILQ